MVVVVVVPTSCEKTKENKHARQPSQVSRGVQVPIGGEVKEADVMVAVCSVVKYFESVRPADLRLRLAKNDGKRSFHMTLI